MNHSPEPWSVRRNDQRIGIFTANGNQVNDARYGGLWEDMDRAVACVNACRGATNEQLVAVVEGKAYLLLGRTFAEVPLYGVSPETTDSPKPEE
jgi:hypothetical protein